MSLPTNAFKNHESELIPMRRALFSFLFLVILLAPAFALTIAPRTQEIQFNPLLTGKGELTVATVQPQTCTFSNTDPTNKFEFIPTAPFAGSETVYFTVKAQKLPFKDFVQITCYEQGVAVNGIAMVSGSTIISSNETAMPETALFNSYSQPSPPQFDPKELQYVDYPYLGFIGTGMGSDIIIASLVAIFTAGILWKGVNS